MLLKERVVIFIDGSNIFHAIKALNIKMGEPYFKVEKIVKIMQEFISEMKKIEELSEVNKENVIKNQSYVERIAKLADELLQEISQFRI